MIRNYIYRFLLFTLILILFFEVGWSKHTNHTKHHKRKHGRRSQEETDELRATDLYTGSFAKPVPPMSLDHLPSEWNWCDREGRSFCTASWNQHIPRYCGSCYVHGALAAANDRIKILLDGKHDLMLARQVILNCGARHGLGGGCKDGGEAFDVFEYMHRFGLPDESCQNYVAIESETCDTQAICQNCMPTNDDPTDFICWPVPSPILYYVHSYGKVNGEAAMMTEIKTRGPITCGFASVDDFDYNYRSGIYIDYTNATDMNHDVEVVGWGEENNVKYWIARNSWGSYWGTNGFFKIVRGINNMQFESDCVFALFDVHRLRQVLSGKFGGSMYGLLGQEYTVSNHTNKQKSNNEKHSHSDDDDDEHAHKPQFLYLEEKSRDSESEYRDDSIKSDDAPTEESNPNTDYMKYVREYAGTYSKYVNGGIDQDDGIVDDDKEVDDEPLNSNAKSNVGQDPSEAYIRKYAAPYMNQEAIELKEDDHSTHRSSKRHHRHESADHEKEDGKSHKERSERHRRHRKTSDDHHEQPEQHEQEQQKDQGDQYDYHKWEKIGEQYAKKYAGGYSGSGPAEDGKWTITKDTRTIKGRHGKSEVREHIVAKHRVNSSSLMELEHNKEFIDSHSNLYKAILVAYSNGHKRRHNHHHAERSKSESDSERQHDEERIRDAVRDIANECRQLEDEVRATTRRIMERIEKETNRRVSELFDASEQHQAAMHLILSDIELNQNDCQFTVFNDNPTPEVLMEPQARLIEELSTSRGYSSSFSALTYTFIGMFAGALLCAIVMRLYDGRQHHSYDLIQ